MTADLFSAGFAWDVAHDATPAATRPCNIAGTAARGVSQLAATENATADVPAFSRDFAWNDDAVASVADVATPERAPIAIAMSHPSCATPVATAETADFRGAEADFLAGVAPVASVAYWGDAITTLREGSPPDGVSGLAWRCLISDARMLVANWGADLIAAGWSTLDVFGVNAMPAARRLDRVGLCRLLKGRPVEAIDAHTALIRVGVADMHTFDRRLVAAGGVPFWRWAGVE